MFSVLFLVPVILQGVQGYSAFDAGLTLLPQGLAMGIAVVLGDRIYMKKLLSIRTTVMAGMLLLAASTASLLWMDVSTPTWFTSLVMTARGFCIGLIIQPLLYELLTTLRPEETADGNTLFNVVQRLSGSVGISALATVFQSQTTGYVTSALASMHLPAGTANIGQNMAALSTLPPALKGPADAAAIHGFHDTIIVLTFLAVIGLALAAFLGGKRKSDP